ncbi:MAG TPA: YihY/virulence factor BrkB family protein [Anaerovoracaceae bacterium]|nr:YihY/virulence factor BrkB family protein [Anaerovoracaceae bacterium]
MKKRVPRMILLAIKQFQDPYYQGFAAQIAFYFLLSLVPIIIVLSQLVGIFEVSLDFLEDMIDNYVSSDVTSILKDLLNYKPVGATNVFFIILALWAASRAQFSMARITNYTISDGKTTGKGYFKERIRAVGTIIITLFTIAFSLIILVYGETIVDIVFGKIVEGSVVDKLWQFLRWPIAMLLYFLMISYNYYVLPSERVPFKRILPGSTFASVGMLLVTMLYSNYTSYIANYDLIYGSLATIVALLFWFYFLAWVWCLGVVFNKVWSETK